ncbi:hypothetical protein HZB02_07290 [Candidatus Woesearchaeota archaeon]|nr:hypothetical protein [Candidatus Woesearchaeota archaeon]
MENNQQTRNPPEKKFQAGPITAIVWNNTSTRPAAGGQPAVPATYKTISLERIYKDRNNQWQNTNSLRLNDLPKAALVLQKAYEYLVITEKGNAAATALAEEDIAY